MRRARQTEESRAFFRLAETKLVLSSTVEVISEEHMLADCRLQFVRLLRHIFAEERLQLVMLELLRSLDSRLAEISFAEISTLEVMSA